MSANNIYLVSKKFPFPLKGMQWLGLFALLIFTSKGNAQSLKRQTIASSGTCISGSGITIQQTIGQPYGTTSNYDNNTRFNPGFQQPVFSIETIKSVINATVYPNPASNQITIVSTKILENVTLQIFDITGKLLLNEKIDVFKSYTINCSNWSNGAYLITLCNPKSDLYSSKLIISR